MNPLVSPLFRYAYYYNAKSACTSHRKIMLELHRSLLPNGDELRLWDVNSTFTVSNFPDDYAEYFTFTIVRNPYQRLVSAYLDKCFEFKYPDDKRYQNQAFNNSIHAPLFASVGRAIDFSIGYSFHEFIDYLTGAETKNYAGVDHHFLPQLARPETPPMDAVYRIEDDIAEMKAIFDEILRDNPHRREYARRLCDKHGVSRENVTVDDGDQRITYEGFLGDSKFGALDELKRDGFKFDYGSFYNDDIARQVTALVQEELDLYGYSFPFEA